MPLFGDTLHFIRCFIAKIGGFQNRYLLRTITLIFLTVLYCVLTQKYRAYDIDNPWFLSFSYNACHGNVETDEFEQFRFPSGMDGVHLFGKVAARIQCLVMNRAGWTPATVVGLNVAFGTISFWLFWSALRRLGYRETWIASFILLLGVTEPIVSMMEKARYEFFAFFLLCLAIWVGVQGWELIASLVALLAVETEPAGILVPIVVVMLLASRTKRPKTLVLKVMLTGITALTFYVTLHPGALHEMLTAPAIIEKFPLGGTLRAYFIDRRRHLTELLVLLIGAGLYWKHKQAIPTRAPVWLALVTSFILCLLHPTAAYVVFVIPFLLWPILEAFDHAKSWRWIPALLFIFLLAGYAYLYGTNLHEGFSDKDFSLVEQQIYDYARASHISDDQLRIVGDYSLWFAHPQHYRAMATPESLNNADLYLCFDGPLQKKGLSALTSMWCSEAQSLVRMHAFSSVSLKGHLLHLYALDK